MRFFGALPTKSPTSLPADHIPELGLASLPGIRIVLAEQGSQEVVARCCWGSTQAGLEM